jgi:hypothetical protein
MKLVLPTIEFGRAATVGAGGLALAPRPTTLDGKVIGFLDGWADRQPDGSYEMYPLMSSILRRLNELYDLAGHKWQKKPHVSHPVPGDELERFLEGVDVVVNGECA